MKNHIDTKKLKNSVEISVKNSDITEFQKDTAKEKPKQGNKDKQETKGIKGIMKKVLGLTLAFALVSTIALADVSGLQNTSTLYVDLTNNEVGINDVDPSTTLDVNGLLRLAPQTVTPSAALISTGGVVINSAGTMCNVSGTTWVRTGTSTICTFLPAN